MRTIQATEAKANLAKFLRTVETGESIAITRHGRTVAHLVPAQDQECARRREAVERFLERRRGWRKTKMSTQEILAARHEGHRF
ncbi:MAG: type II toxin-antitoxin system prevent-host-death family antitoxin [Acidobacteriota bacterium]|nr:type II toxin-antitoxin system prevent-host-death family antitoxin [Acidobacteriota bacterium]